jgi:hypothetical protein
MKKYVVTCCFEILHDKETNADIETCIHELVKEDLLINMAGENFYIVQVEEVALES